MIGPLRAHKGVRDAVWVTDMLHYLYPELNLVLVGDPPPARELEGLAHITRVHRLGPCADVTPILNRADVIWVPGRAGGVTVALEAMAAGKPVLAGRTPEVAEVVEDNVTGLLFSPGDKTELARLTRLLLDEPERRRTLGETGRRRAAERFAPSAQAARYTALLDGV